MKKKIKIIYIPIIAMYKVRILFMFTQESRL